LPCPNPIGYRRKIRLDWFCVHYVTWDIFRRRHSLPWS
jgi:hypothetical protein